MGGGRREGGLGRIVGVAGWRDVRGLEYKDRRDIVGSRRVTSAPGCGVCRVVSSLVVSSRDEDRDGLPSLGTRDPKGPVENPLHSGAEDPAP